MASNIIAMPATTTMTAEMALKSALDLDMTDVLIAGYDQDGDLVVRSSRLLRSDALWLAEKMRQYALEAD